MAESESETMDNARAACHDCSELHFGQHYLQLPTASPSPLSLSLSLSCSFLLPLEHLELVAAQTIRQPLFWVKTTHRRTNVEHSALVNWQRGEERERERARGQRSQALPFCAQHYSLNLKLSLKLWSISRFTAPKCRKFAHSFGSLVGNLSKSIKYIHTYVYIS